MPHRKTSLGIAAWCCLTILLVTGWLILVPEDDWKIARVTFSFGLASAAFSVPIGFLLAWAEYRVRRWSVTVPFIFILSLLLIPLHLHVAVWDAAIGKLGFMRIWNEALDPQLSGMSAAVFVQTMAMIPWTALFGAVSVRILGQNPEQLASLDAHSATVFWRVTVRRWIPLLLLAVIWVVVCSNREIAVTDIYQIGTYAEEIYLQHSGGRFDWFGIDPNTGQATGSIGVLAYCLLTSWMILTTLICILILVPTQQLTDLVRDQLPLPSWRMRTYFMYTWGVCAVLIVIPIVNLIIRGGLQTRLIDSEPVTRFEWQHLVDSLMNVLPSYRGEAGWSLAIGLATATCATGLSLLLVTWLRRSRIGNLGLLVLIAASLAIPGPLIGVLVSRIFTALPGAAFDNLYNRTICGPVVATTLVALGPALGLLWICLRNVPQETIEAAELEGVTRSASTRKMTIGQQASAIGCCFLICFLIGFGDLSASYIPMPPGMDTLGRCTLGQLHAGVNDMTAALSLVSWFFIGTISMISIFALANTRKRSMR